MVLAKTIRSDGEGKLSIDLKKKNFCARVDERDDIGVIPRG